jgi:hypothetical protein
MGTYHGRLVDQGTVGKVEKRTTLTLADLWSKEDLWSNQRVYWIWLSTHDCVGRAVLTATLDVPFDLVELVGFYAKPIPVPRIRRPTTNLESLFRSGRHYNLTYIFLSRQPSLLASEFRSMVIGEEISVNRSNRDSVTFRPNVPGVLMSN